MKVQASILISNMNHCSVWRLITLELNLYMCLFVKVIHASMIFTDRCTLVNTWKLFTSPIVLTGYLSCHRRPTVKPYWPLSWLVVLPCTVVPAASDYPRQHQWKMIAQVSPLSGCEESPQKRLFHQVHVAQNTLARFPMFQFVMAILVVKVIPASWLWLQVGIVIWLSKVSRLESVVCWQGTGCA